MTEQFNALIEKESEPELLSYLQSLTDDQKKKIIPQIKRLTKEYSQFGDLGGGSYGHINGTSAQRELLQLACFVCFNRADYDKSPFSIWMLEKERLTKIIDWYCPSWFSDFVNKQASLDYVPYYLHYDWIMELTSKGFLNPSKELLVKIMPQMIFEKATDRTWELKTENLLKIKITLEEHIWYLFELESNLHYSDRYLQFENTISKEKIGWVFVFKKYSDENILDRFRLLKESLLASNRNFNKVLSGWFSQLFIELEPTKEEILGLQNELFSTLGSPHSKPVNASLQTIKKIVHEKDFNISSFLDATPLLFSSNTKATIISSLLILEKSAQNAPAYSQRISLLICQCFIHPDEEVQSKAAKLIAKFGIATDPALRHELTSFYPGMFTTARQLLSSFYDFEVEQGPIETNNDEEQTINAPVSLSELAKIPFPANIDDLIFLTSQAFDNNEPWHIDVLPSALIHFRSQLKAEDVSLFEPALQRAFGLIKTNFRSTTGYLDHLLAIFFIDFGNWIINRFPSASESLKKIYQKYDTKEGERQTSFLVPPSSGFYTAHWEPFNKITFYQPYKQLLLEILEKIKRGNDLPVLSTPTHAPSWISPHILIHRLRHYQQAGQEPDNMDLQVAISRVFLYTDTNVREQVSKELSGELQALMSFLLKEEAAPQKPFNFKAAWMVASLTKKEKKAWAEFDAFSYNKKPLKSYTGQLPWQAIEELNTSNRYDYELRKYVQTPITRKALTVQKGNIESEKSGLKKILFKLLPVEKNDPPMLYESLSYRLPYLSVEHNDIKRILSLTPNNPDPVLADIITKCLKYPEFWEEADKKMIIAVLQFLHETWQEPGEMAYLFLGACMFSADKTAINIAGEIWLKAVTIDKISNIKLGKVIGSLESIEFAPLKRFTDLVSQNLFRISALHNHEMQTLIEHTLPQLPEAPIKNLKKLLEIYAELIAMNNSESHPSEVMARLKIWEETPGLKKTIGKITKL